MKKRPREPKPLHPSLASSTGPALIKHLASCNTTVRSQSLRLIQSWLASQSQELSDSDVKKLWKGLFYCLWHADKTPNQVALIDRLVSLFLSLQGPVCLEFFRGFLITLRREWPGIDRLRLDKFYLLIRRFIRALFELMRLRKWDVEVLGEYFGVLQSYGFLAEDKVQGNGVNYHMVSVFLEELKVVGFPVRKEVIDVILSPFFAVLMKCNDRILLGKLKSCLFDELMKVGKEMLVKKKMGGDFDENDGDVLLGLVALKMGLSGKFYEVGSSVECVQGNRKVALALHGEFLKLEKELESCGIEISIPEYIDVGDKVDDDDVPQLIPTENVASNGDVEMVSQDEDGRRRKKSKKAKKEIDVDDKKEKKQKKKKSNGDVEMGSQEDDRKFKKIEKAKNGMDVDDKKEKKKKKKRKRKDENGVSEISSVGIKENGDSVIANGVEDFNSLTNGDDLANDVTGVDLDEDVISNLQNEFEKVAAEAGSNLSDIPLISVKQGKCANKRKRTKGADNKDSSNLETNSGVNAEFDGGAKSVEKSAKKVHFSMKNNLVWKPQTPLPPESLRLPPSVTPRGSALKKGVPPGPVIEMPHKKKMKQRKKLRSATPAKRRNDIQTRSA